jgi:predicted chitinase
MVVSSTVNRAPRRALQAPRAIATPAPRVVAPATVVRATAQEKPAARPAPQPAEGTFEKLGRWLDGLLGNDAPAPQPDRPAKPRPAAPKPQPQAPEPSTPAPAAPAPAPAVDMPILTRGDAGELVLFLQKKLGEVGFPLSATPNGVFGPATEAAVRAFQAAHGIPTTGNVGPLTWAALGVQKNPIVPKGAVKLQLAATADLLNAPVDTFTHNWPYLAKALKEAGIKDRATVIAVLATIHVETSHFAPINEYGGPSYWARYNDRTDLGNRPGTQDGVTYHGRGYIQLTGRANYLSYGQKLGIDLVNHPDLALDPNVAARILVAYFQSRGIPDMARRGDWLAVRRAVNGGTNGYDAFSQAVTALQAHPALFKA